MDRSVCHLALMLSVVAVCLLVGGFLALASFSAGAAFAFAYEHVLR